MRSFRSERVNKLIREEISKIIGREVEFNALVTVTAVTVDKKMEHARVQVSVIPEKAEVPVLKELANRAGSLQHLLLKRVNIQPMPRIYFEIDKGLENAAAVEKALLDQ